MKKITGFSSLVLLATLGFMACSKEVTSQQSFIHKAKAPAAGVALTYAGKNILETEFLTGIQNEVYELEKKIYELKLDRAKAIVVEQLVNQLAKAKNLTSDAYLEQEIASKASVSQADIDSFVKQRNIPKEHLNDELKERVRQFLLQEKKKEMVDSWMNEQLKKSPVTVYFTKPQRPIFDVKVGDGPILGKKSAPVAVVEFSDFQCPYCAKGSKIMHDLKKKYGNKIKVAFKNFPLSFHRQAKGAAHAGLCVFEQSNDRFWDLHDHMFDNQQSLKEEELELAVAKLEGINLDSYKKCMKSKKYTASIDQDIAQGNKLGIKSTPTFFVNGKLVNGAQPIEVFSELIEEDL